MSKKTARNLATAAGPVVVAVMAWLGGYNFDSRGFWPAWGFGVCVAYMVWQWSAPWWKE